MNNLFDRVKDADFNGVTTLNLYNNLFYHCDLEFSRDSTNVWIIKDNSFDNCPLMDWNLPSVNDCNAYINMLDTLQSPGANNVALTNFSYGTFASSLGQYYQVSTNLYARGSRSASVANLAHYTVRTNQAVEGASPVSIGYHYVALTNGVPADGNTNNVPDYLEDRRDGCICEVCNPPVVTLTNPTSGQVFVIAPTNIVLAATASDDGYVSKVDFYCGTNWLGVATSAPYSLVWQNVTNGTYSVSAIATDNEGSVSTSTATNVILNAMPTVNLVSPTNATVVRLAAGASTTNLVLQATAFDTDGSSPTVQFFSWTNLIGNGTRNGTNYQYAWSGVTNGNYALSAKATDNRGAVRASDLVALTVNPANDFPSVSIISPTNGTSLKAFSDLTICAGAADSNGIARVEFYNGTNFLGSDTTASASTNFTVTVHGMRPGSYTLAAKAVDQANPAGRNLSTPVDITVNQPEPTGEGHWDPVFGSTEEEGEPGGSGLWSEYALALDSAGNVFSGPVYRETGPRQRVRKWTKADCGWTDQVSLLYGGVFALKRVGADLYVGGFGSEAGMPIGKLTSTNIAQIGNGLDFDGTPDPDVGVVGGSVRAVELIDGDLYIGGGFTSAGGDTNFQFVAKLAGVSGNWTGVGNGLQGGVVRAIAEFQDSVYVGGDFTSAGTNGAQYVARLVNGRWQPVGVGVNAPVWSLTAHNGRLFVGGDFTSAGGLTNANHIACWDGLQWTTISSGVTDGDDDNWWFLSDVATRVNAIAGRGDEIYVAGDFTKAWNGSQPVTANYVARAVWDEKTQTWSWSALDDGLDGWDSFSQEHWVSTHGLALAIRERTDTVGYDVIVAGTFNRAGGLPSFNLARWVVTGSSECPTNGPSIQIASPTEGTNLTNNAVTLIATVQTNGAVMGNVDFYLNGTRQGLGDLRTNGSYSLDIPDLAAGPYSVTATAIDSQSRSASARPVNFTVKGTSGPMVASDLFHVLSTGAATNLNVLANDTSSGGALRLVGVNKWQNPFTTARVSSSVQIGYGTTNLVYQANPFTFGTNVISYDTADNNGTNTGNATVIVHAPPQATISFPTDGALYTTTSVNLNVTGTALDYDGSISSQ